ncbi:hypothetical protein EYF80_036221 [Liparis tanakae]|uniref:Uncharacterized protein n=1 Tax=Liparis tanakae TaxID=230148 RepID=A0A4Z2GJ57_9TELE|nr:hypothetical protein EYF80_036221 [Liparis tanakae]
MLLGLVPIPQAIVLRMGQSTASLGSSFAWHRNACSWIYSSRNPTHASAFFRGIATFPVYYLRELHARCRDTTAPSHLMADCGTLVSIQNTTKCGLHPMPFIELTIASIPSPSGHRHKTRVTAVPSCSIPTEGESIPVRGYHQGRGSTPPGDRHRRLPLLKVGRSLAEQDFQRTVYSQYFWSHMP